MSINVCAVVVTQNRPELLKECIDALLPQVSHVVIFDNAGSQETKNILSLLEINSKILVKHSEKNLGGAGGFSNGLDYGMTHTDDDYFWIMDDDTIPANDAIYSFESESQKLNNKFGFFCSDVTLEDGRHVNIPTTSSDWNEKIEDYLVKVNVATFVSIFVRREVIKSVGLPISEMFIWGDDTEYTTRISQEYNNYFVINSKVVHKTKATLPNIDIYNDDRIQRYFYRTRNVLYCSRMYDKKIKTVFMIVKDIMCSIKCLFKAENNRFKRSFIIIKGTFAGLLFNPTIKKIK